MPHLNLPCAIYSMLYQFLLPACVRSFVDRIPQATWSEGTLNHNCGFSLVSVDSHHYQNEFCSLPFLNKTWCVRMTLFSSKNCQVFLFCFRYSNINIKAGTFFFFHIQWQQQPKSAYGTCPWSASRQSEYHRQLWSSTSLFASFPAGLQLFSENSSDLLRWDKQ